MRRITVSAVPGGYARRTAGEGPSQGRTTEVWFRTSDRAKEAVEAWIACKGDVEAFWRQLTPFPYAVGDLVAQYTSDPQRFIQQVGVEAVVEFGEVVTIRPVRRRRAA